MLRDTLAQKWEQIQGSLFPWIVEEIGEISEKQQQLISILELLRVEEYSGPRKLDNRLTYKS